MSRFVDHAVFLSLLLVVVLAPIPLASNVWWAWALICFMSGALTLVWLLNRLVGRKTVVMRLPAWIPLFYLLAITWAWVQAQPWTPTAWHHPIWQLAAELLGQELDGSISLAPQDNFTAIMRLLAYGLVFFLAFQFARDRHLARKTLWWVFVAAVFYSFYGLLSYWGVLRELMWYQDDSFGHYVRATFVNRNHWANWSGIAIIASLGLFIDYMLRAPINPMLAMQGRQKQFDRFMARAWAPLAGLILMVSGLVASYSRGGFIATFLGGVCLLMLIDRKQRIVSVKTRAIAVSALLVCAAAFMVSSEILVERFDQSELDAKGRTMIYQRVAHGISDNPVLGFGYGAFEDGFKLYRGEEIGKRVDFAHNTFLENLFELGAPAAFLLFMAMLGLVLVCLRGLFRRHRDWVFPAIGVGASMMVAVHANLDFGLQIPATAVLYALVMGVSCAQSFSSVEHR